MRLTVKPDRLEIRVEVNGNKSASFPGEWASNFSVDEKGELIRKDWKNKFYVDRLKNIFWESTGNHEQVKDAELQECIQAIQAEAEKNGWQIIWPN